MRSRALQEWVSLIDSLGLTPNPLARTSVEGFFRAANSEQDQFRALGGDDNDEKSLSFPEFLEALVLVSDSCFSMDREPTPVAAVGGGKGGLLGPLGALRHLLAEAAIPLGARIGLGSVRDALRSRPLLALVSGNMGVLEGVFGYYGVPLWAARDRRKVAAEYRRRGGAGLPLLLPPHSSGVGGGDDEKSAAPSSSSITTTTATTQPPPTFSSHTLGLAMLDSPGLFINPSRVVGGCKGVVGEVHLVAPKWSLAAAAGGNKGEAVNQQHQHEGGEGHHSTPTAAAAAAATLSSPTPAAAAAATGSPSAAPNTRPPTTTTTTTTTASPSSSSPAGKKSPVKGVVRMTAKEAKEAAEKKAAAAAAAKAAAIPPKVFVESDPRFIDLETFTELLTHAGLYTPLAPRGAAAPPATPAAAAGQSRAGAGRGDPHHQHHPRNTQQQHHSPGGVDMGGGDNHSVVSQGTTTSSAIAAAAAAAIASAGAGAGAGAGGTGGGSSGVDRAAAPVITTIIDSGPALEALTGRKAGKGEKRQLYPAPGILTERELARSFWVARVCPTPGTRRNPPPGLPLPHLCEAVARAAAFKWAPLVGLPLGWAGECSDSEFEAWLVASGKVLQTAAAGAGAGGSGRPFGGGIFRVAAKPLPPPLRPLVLQQLVEWGIKAVMNVGGHLGEGGRPPLPPHLLSAGNFCVASLDPLVAVEVAETWAAGGGGDTPLLNDMLRNGVPLPGRPKHAPALNLLPPARETDLVPEDVGVGVGVGVGGKPKWKPKDAFSFLTPG